MTPQPPRVSQGLILRSADQVSKSQMKIKMSKESVHKGQKHNSNKKSRGHSKADLSWFQMQIIEISDERVHTAFFMAIWLHCMR